MLPWVGEALVVEDLAPVLRCVTYRDPEWERWFNALPKWKQRLYRAWSRVRRSIPSWYYAKEWLHDLWIESKVDCGLPWALPYMTEAQRREYDAQQREIMKDLELLVRALEAGRP